MTESPRTTLAPFSEIVVPAGFSKVTNELPKFYYPSLPTHSASECDFESGSCGWHEHTLGDGFDWVLGSSMEVPPDCNDRQPPLDHSTNSTEGKETITPHTQKNLPYAVAVFIGIRIEI